MVNVDISTLPQHTFMHTLRTNNAVSVPSIIDVQKDVHYIFAHTIIKGYTMIKAFKTLKENNTSGEVTTVWRQVDVKKEVVVGHRLVTRPIEELYKGSTGVKTWKAKDVLSSDVDQVTIKQEWYNGDKTVIDKNGNAIGKEHVHHVVFVTYCNSNNLELPDDVGYFHPTHARLDNIIAATHVPSIALTTKAYLQEARKR